MQGSNGDTYTAGEGVNMIMNAIEFGRGVDRTIGVSQLGVNTSF